MSISAATGMREAKAKVNPRERLGPLYHPSVKEVAIVEVPDMAFLMVDGAGDPNHSHDYQQAIEALYGVAYTLKFLLKREQRIDYVMMPLEGLWRVPDMREFRMDDKEAWLWTMMIMQPDEVTPALFERACDQVRHKRPSPALARMRLQRFHEGLAAQVMYVGPYAMEGPTIVRLHAFIHDLGFTFDGREQKHHEIYLSDPRRAAPEKMRTVIRQPITRPA